MPLSRFFTISRELSSARSATTYVPIVIFSRGLAFLRLLLVAKILGNAGEREFGLYQPALELINWLVPLVMFGLADVAERFAAKFEAEGRLAAALKRQFTRLLACGVAIALLLSLCSRWLAPAIFRLPNADHSGVYGTLLIVACAATILLLAIDIYISAVLRGIRAYSAAAGMELLASSCLFAFSILAAFWKPAAAVTLVAAYALSLLIANVFYLIVLLKHLRTLPKSETAPATPTPRLNRFAAWSLIRLLLVMSFGFVSIWAVGLLSKQSSLNPQSQTAAFSMPYRIAQLLAYVGITLWASVYGIAAGHWSHQQTRRAKVELFRIGKFGAVILTLTAVFLLLARSVIAAILPGVYSDSIVVLLPPMLAMFIWYSLLSFAGTYADLQEAPWKSAMLWAFALAIQLTLIFFPVAATDPQRQVLYASTFAVGVPLLIFAPLLLWRPMRLSATFIPLAMLSIAPLSLFAPPWVVDYLAPPIMLAPIAFLYVSGLLLRPRDKKALRRRFAH